jgi:hypothetical protein
LSTLLLLGAVVAQLALMLHKVLAVVLVVY